MSGKNIVYFDLETQRSFGDVGGAAHKDKMGVSVAVTYSTARGSYRIYGESDLNQLVDELVRADLVVGSGAGAGSRVTGYLGKTIAPAGTPPTGFDFDTLPGFAGGVFVGHLSAESIGDYTAGPSHIMPTGGTARFSSPLNLDDFLKITSVFSFGPDEIRRIGPAAIAIARAEGLEAHARAVEARLEHLE